MAIGRGVPGLDPERLTVVKDGLIEIALLIPGVAAVDRTRLVPGLEPERLVIVGDGLVVLVFSHQTPPRFPYASAFLGSIRIASV